MMFSSMNFQPWKVGDRVRVNLVGPHCGHSGTVIKVEPENAYYAESAIYIVQMDRKDIQPIKFSYWNLDLIDGETYGDE